jgi:hypothetical protein
VQRALAVERPARRVVTTLFTVAQTAAISRLTPALS